MRAQELTALGRPLDALPILRAAFEDNKTAKKRLEAYVYQIIGRWKDTRGTEYVFRRRRELPHCRRRRLFRREAGMKSPWAANPYPTTGAYSVVSVRGSTRDPARPAKRQNDSPELSGRGRRQRKKPPIIPKTERQNMKKKDIIIIAAVLLAAPGALWRIPNGGGQSGFDRRGDGRRGRSAPPPAGYVGYL